MDDSADATVLARGHELGVLDVRLWDEDRIWVKTIEHGFDGSLIEFAWVDFIDIIEVELAQEAVIDVEALGNFEVVLFLLGDEAQGEAQGCD